MRFWYDDIMLRRRDNKNHEKNQQEGLCNLMSDFIHHFADLYIILLTMSDYWVQTIVNVFKNAQP